MASSKTSRWRTLPLTLAVSAFTLIALSTPASAATNVWDFIWHTGGGPNLAWGEGVWTKDGVSLFCPTFPGGVGTTPPPDVHISDHKICPEQPNDWHWNVSDGVNFAILVWFTWGSIPTIPTLEVPIPDVGPTPNPPYMLMVDVEADTWEFTDDAGPICNGNWSLYPVDFCGTMIPDVQRHTHAETLPALSIYGMAALVTMLGLGSVLMMRRRNQTA